jgi:hypothetical protein
MEQTHPEIRPQEAKDLRYTDTLFTEQEVGHVELIFSHLLVCIIVINLFTTRRSVVLDDIVEEGAKTLLPSSLANSAFHQFPGRSVWEATDDLLNFLQKSQKSVAAQPDYFPFKSIRFHYHIIWLNADFFGSPVSLCDHVSSVVVY